MLSLLVCSKVITLSGFLYLFFTRRWLSSLNKAKWQNNFIYFKQFQKAHCVRPPLPQKNNHMFVLLIKGQNTYNSDHVTNSLKNQFFLLFSMINDQTANKSHSTVVPEGFYFEMLLLMVVYEIVTKEYL